MTEITITEAADRLGTTVEALTLSRARGLAPGRLGYTKPPYDGTVYFDTADLELDAELKCAECDFEAASAGGLTQHTRAKHAAVVSDG